MYGNSQYMLDSLNRQKERIDEMIRNYQQPQPVNNFINTGQTTNTGLYDFKVLNDGDEVENVFVNNNTIFMGINRMQIKKLDGTIEKYNIEKTYPIDKKDEKINALEEEIRKLKEVLNEHTKSIEPIRECNKPNDNANGNVEPKSKTSSKSISK